MTEMTLNAVFGPRYEITIQQQQVAVGEGFNLTLEKKEPLRLNVGTGFNSTPGNGSKSGTLDVRVTAQEVVNAYRAIGYDGLFSQPNANSLSNYAGVTRVATVAGEDALVIRSGYMQVVGWNWTANNPIFITNQGVLTQTVPVGVPIRRIGWAISPTEVNFDPYPIIGA